MIEPFTRFAGAARRLPFVPYWAPPGFVLEADVEYAPADALRVLLKVMRRRRPLVRTRLARRFGLAFEAGHEHVPLPPGTTLADLLSTWLAPGGGRPLRAPAVAATVAPAPPPDPVPPRDEPASTGPRVRRRRD